MSASGDDRVRIRPGVDGNVDPAIDIDDDGVTIVTRIRVCFVFVGVIQRCCIGELKRVLRRRCDSQCQRQNFGCSDGQVPNVPDPGVTIKRCTACSFGSVQLNSGRQR